MLRSVAAKVLFSGDSQIRRAYAFFAALGDQPCLFEIGGSAAPPLRYDLEDFIGVQNCPTGALPLRLSLREHHWTRKEQLRAYDKLFAALVCGESALLVDCASFSSLTGPYSRKPPHVSASTLLHKRP